MNLVPAITSAIFYFTILSNSLLPQAVIKLDEGIIKKAYQKAKAEFDAFEKKHGRYVQTNNVLMHYLTWGDPSKPALI
jgi:hypothetical protein